MFRVKEWCLEAASSYPKIRVVPPMANVRCVWCVGRIFLLFLLEVKMLLGMAELHKCGVMVYWYEQHCLPTAPLPHAFATPRSGAYAVVSPFCCVVVGCARVGAAGAPWLVCARRARCAKAQAAYVVMAMKRL